MNPDYLEQLQSCCRDQAAFERMQQILVKANHGVTQLEQHRTLFQIVTKLHETLDLETIFQTATVEIQQLFNVDRVAIFRFQPNSDWKVGEFVAEAVQPKFPSVLSARHNLGRHDANPDQLIRVQAVADIYAVDDCDAALSRFQIRAFLNVPLLQGSQLWGLLCIHQCHAPRDWQPDQVEFAAQAGVQLAIALERAELLAQTRRQTQELTAALSQIKQNQAQLFQTEKMSGLGQLIAGLAHEINNPINFICGNLAHASQYTQQLLELLSLYQQEHHSPSPALNQCLAEIDFDFVATDFPKLMSSMKIGSDRIRQMVLSLRNFSQTDALEGQPIELQSIDLNQSIDSTLLILQHRLKPKAESSGIQVVCEYGDLSRLESYGSQINQVLLNLIGNAIDAVESAAQRLSQEIGQPAPPQIKIRTMQIPDPQGGNPRAVICIADNGPGIPFEVQEQMFEPFFTTKPVGKGIGLGLSISRDIVVNQHGGDIQCYSQPDGGTEFWIELPIRAAAAVTLSYAAYNTSHAVYPAAVIQSHAAAIG
jgi:signal transduction histidine kinase